jgi:anti-sigma B factor antagonist
MDDRYPITTVSGVPVITPPAEVDVSTTDQLRLALLKAAAPGQTTIVVDMTQTQFCDSAGLIVLTRAHERAMARGGELRLVIPADGAVFRIVTLMGLHRIIPRFDCLNEALLPRPAGVIPLLQPRRAGGLPWLPPAAPLSGGPGGRSGRSRRRRRPPGCGRAGPAWP